MISWAPLSLVAQPNWQNPDYIEKAFIEIALKNEYRSTDLKVIKWQQPIHYQIEFRNMPSHKMLTEHTRIHLKHLAAITGLNITETQKSANFKIIFTQYQAYQKDIAQYTSEEFAKKLARESHCMGNYRLNQDHSIKQAVVIIPVDHVFSKGLFMSCLVEETTQLMGLPNDSNWVNPSIANDLSKIELLTGLDYLFLKLLYNPKLKAGMPIQQSRPLIRQQIETLEKNGTIQKSAKLINQQGLNKLFY